MQREYARTDLGRKPVGGGVTPTTGGTIGTVAGMGDIVNMRVGMNLLLWTTEVGPSHRKLLKQIRDWGFDGVEIPIFSPHPQRARDLGLLLDDLGLERTAVTVVPPDANPIHPDPSVRTKALEYLKSVVEACHLAGIRLLAGPLHSPVGLLAGRSRTQEEWRWALEILQQTADLARSARITLALEFLNRFESYFLNCAKDTVEFTAQADRPNLGILYDTYHAHLEEKNVSTAIRSCAGALRHVHISENDRATPGEGQVRWQETFDTLKDVRYADWLVIEAFGQAMPELAAATCIWRRMFPSEEHLARNGLEWIRSNWD